MIQESHYDYMLRRLREADEEIEREPMKVTAETVLKDALELKKQKSKDYQGDQWTEEDYFPFGHQSFVHMLWTKMLRIRSVAEKNDTNFESLEDSLLDMINYSAMYAAWVENQRLNESQ